MPIDPLKIYNEAKKATEAAEDSASRTFTAIAKAVTLAKVPGLSKGASTLTIKAVHLNVQVAGGVDPHVEIIVWDTYNASYAKSFTIPQRDTAIEYFLKLAAR